MVELSQAARHVALEKRGDGGRLARERLLWAVKPFGFLGIVLWILSPGTSDVPASTLHSNLVLAFLLGSAYGVLVFWQEIKRYVAFRLDGGRDQKNRLPDEFYVGTIDEVRAEWNR